MSENVGANPGRGVSYPLPLSFFMIFRLINISNNQIENCINKVNNQLYHSQMVLFNHSRQIYIHLRLCLNI